MKISRVILALSLASGLGSAVCGQASGPDPIRTLVDNLPDGHAVVRVENLSPQPITAIAIVGTRIINKTSQTDISVRFFDSVLSERQKPIFPNGSTTFSFFGPKPLPQQTKRYIEVKAVLFGTGGSWGDTEWVSRLINRRAYVHQTAVGLIAEIDDMLASSPSRADVIRHTQEERDRAMRQSSDIDEQQIAEITFANVLLKFSEANEPDGSPIPLESSFLGAKGWLRSLRERIERSKPAIVQ